MKHDSKHRGALYMNPSFAENIKTATLMTGNLGHHPVPMLEVPVKPFYRTTGLDAYGVLGTGDAAFELAFNFAEILIHDAVRGDDEYFPRLEKKASEMTLDDWKTMQLFCYDMVEDVSCLLKRRTRYWLIVEFANSSDRTLKDYSSGSDSWIILRQE